MSYYRIQNYPATDLLDGPQLSFSWNAQGDDERAREGKSVCYTREDLANYLAQTGIPFDATWTLVELDGYLSDDDDEDAHLGAMLIHPTKIIATEPISESFLDEINTAIDALEIF